MKFIKYFFIFGLVCLLLGAASIYGVYRYISPQLPDVATLKDVQLQMPMSVYSADNQLIAQFGEKRRIPLQLSQIPPLLVDAFVATEDSRFYEHHGVDPIGIFRASWIALISGHASQGASTITQQLARNYFLSPERTLTRKLKEALLAMRIEKLFTKDQILELYLNKIYLGQRAYGVGAAAEVYFGRNINQLTVAEMAMIAGLPKAPSTFNPIYSHSRALARRNVVLARMLQEGYINQQQYQQALKEPLISRYHPPKLAFNAPYLAEMVRQEMVDKYGEDAYTDGYKVYTTLTEKLQNAAQQALRANVLDYDMRHGYRGPAQQLWQASQTAWPKPRILALLATLPDYKPLAPAVVMAVSAKSADVLMANDQTVTLTLDQMRWARRFINDHRQGALPKRVSDVVAVGQQIWLHQQDDGQWLLGQLPEVNSALVSINPQDGAIMALVGGFSFDLSKFNRATQSLRQVGSNIKPFLYTAALNKGLTLASLINDAPITIWDEGAGKEWRPKNSPPRYDGPIRVRQGLGQSKNVVMVRVMRAMGVDYAADYLQRFGFPASNIDRTESLALGTPSFTPLQMVRGYAVFDNGGYLVTPYFITKIEDEQAKVVFQVQPQKVCSQCDVPVMFADPPMELLAGHALDAKQDKNDRENQPLPTPDLTLAAQDKQYPHAPHVVSQSLAFLMHDALRSNIMGEPGWMGTGWRAKALKRNDIGGKTGTTNSSKDAWFSGYGTDHLVTTVWIGFDNPNRDLGKTTLSGAIKNQISGAEGGAKSAQPAWDSFMQVALAGQAEKNVVKPKDVVSIRISRSNGRPSNEKANSVMEYFIKGTEPTINTNNSNSAWLLGDGSTANPPDNSSTNSNRATPTNSRPVSKESLRHDLF